MNDRLCAPLCGPGFGCLHFGVPTVYSLFVHFLTLTLLLLLLTLLMIILLLLRLLMVLLLMLFLLMLLLYMFLQLMLDLLMPNLRWCSRANGLFCQSVREAMF